MGACVGLFFFQIELSTLHLLQQLLKKDKKVAYSSTYICARKQIQLDHDSFAASVFKKVNIDTN